MPTRLKNLHVPPSERLLSDASGITWHLVTRLLCSRPCGTAAGTEAAQLTGCEEDRKYLDGLPIHPAASAPLWLQDQRQNKDRRRLVWCWVEASPPPPPSAWRSAEPSALHLLSVPACTCGAGKGREMQPCRFAWIQHCSILLRVRDRVHPPRPTPSTPPRSCTTYTLTRTLRAHTLPTGV